VVARAVTSAASVSAGFASVNWRWKANFLASSNRPGNPGGGAGISVSDPIADMLTRIRNAVATGQAAVAMPTSKVKYEIATLLQEEGYLEGAEVAEGDTSPQKVLRLKIKYIGEHRERKPVFSSLVRVSRPGRRGYTKKQDIPWVLSGMGIAILSTPKGIMTGQRARQLGVGGEILCKVW